MPAPATLLAEALALHRSGQLDSAAQRYREVLVHEPTNADAHHLLGMVLVAQGQCAAAVESLQAAVHYAPQAAEFHRHLGAALLAAGDAERAIQSLREAVRLDSRSAALHNELGAALRAAERWDEAEACFRDATQLDPTLVDAHNNLADALQAQGRLHEAAAAFDSAARRWPHVAELHFNLGNAQFAAENYPAAAAAYRAAIALQPNLGLAHHKLGKSLEAMQDPAAADAHRAAVRLLPERMDILESLGICLQMLGADAEAERHYRRALELEPDHVPMRCYLAMTRYAQGHAAEAQALFEQCIEMAPYSAYLRFQLGLYWFFLGRLSEAIARFREAIDLKPDYVLAHYYCGLSHLALGDFAAGWPERQWRVKELARKFDQPEWQGEPLQGQRVLVYLEHGLGLGDVIQFVRYVPLLERRGGRPVVEVPLTLMPLLSESGFGELVIPQAPVQPPCELQVSLWSLPACFETRVESIPTPIPYLRARPALVETWRQRLAEYRGPKIGIHWHGTQVLPERSIPLAAFEALAQVSGTVLVSLQKHAGAEQLAALGGRFSVVDLGPQLDECAGAFMDTAAIMQHLDLVVTNDTAVAHLGGALGVPTWVGLMHVAEWRWMQNRDDSPWYPSLRLFRQPVRGDWTSVFARMAAELGKLAARRG
jgi:tetratricopeptide (TPR) repeat protein